LIRSLLLLTFPLVLLATALGILRDLLCVLISESVSALLLRSLIVGQGFLLFGGWAIFSRLVVVIVTGRR
jgi:hypothetical protein